ncbi:MAG: hypothetical protein WC592_03505 [Candidatus Omnitrophota bacterium]|nr:hypothetical protein [Candidatus Omnitrophota bacterium]
MSIIQDALKKVENKTSMVKTVQPAKLTDPVRNEFKTAPVFQETGKPYIQKGKSPGRGKSMHTFFLIAAFVLLIGASLAQFPWEAREKGVASPGIELIAEPFSKVDLPPISKTYNKTQSIPTFLHNEAGRLPGFVLNGIMELTDGPKAVINNLIVAVGDTVDGAVVSKIDRKNVVLKVSDSEINLDMK